MIDAGRPLARCLSVLGTGSDVGKSIVVAALCRLFSDMGVRVAPFKAQNMSNNSFVTLDGGEIGRAQVVQAEAARAPVHVDMNPVLLKPSTNTGAQVVVHGKPIGHSEAADYFADTGYLFSQAQHSLDRLRSAYEFIIMEGAGSCAEVNLRDRDFVNFRMAHYADAPVLLVADIDRGGVFAQIIGTLDIIPEVDRRRVRGIIINRFRGDARLFHDGIEYIRNRTGIPVLGLIPWYYHIEIDAEDGMPLDVVIDPSERPDQQFINLAVLRFPHISNFTDFSALSREPAVKLHYLFKPRSLDGYDIVLLPGSKNVRADLFWMCDQQWDLRLRDYVSRGGRIGGICGGYQMLGRIISDPHGIEGPPGETNGLDLLEVHTTFGREKILTRSTGIWAANGEQVEGYEIHMGVTQCLSGVSPVIHVRARNGSEVRETDGAMNHDGSVWGVYFHGLFDSPGFRNAFLEQLKPGVVAGSDHRLAVNATAFKERQYDLLAEHFKANLDMSQVLDIVGNYRNSP